MKYVGVYSFRFSVCPYVCLFARLFICSSFSHVHGHRVKVFALKFIRPHILNSLMDFIHIWPDGRYRSKFLSAPSPPQG